MVRSRRSRRGLKTMPVRVPLRKWQKRFLPHLQQSSYALTPVGPHTRAQARPKDPLRSPFERDLNCADGLPCRVSSGQLKGFLMLYQVCTNAVTRSLTMPCNTDAMGPR